MISFRPNSNFDKILKEYPNIANSTLKAEFIAKRNALEGKIDQFKKELDGYIDCHKKGALNFDLPKKFNDFYAANNPKSLAEKITLNLDKTSSENVKQGISEIENFKNELGQFLRELDRLSKPGMQLLARYNSTGLKGGCQSSNGFVDLLGKAFQLSRGYLSFGSMTLLNKLILAALPPGTSQEMKDLVNVLCTTVAVLIHEKCAAAAGSTVPSMYLRNPTNNFWKDLATEKAAWLMFTISREIETAVVKTMSEHMQPSMAKKVGDAFLSVIFTYLVAGMGVPLWQQTGRRYLGGQLKQNDLSSSQVGAYLEKVFTSTVGFEVKGTNLDYYGRGIFSMAAKAIALLAIWYPVNKLVLPGLFPSPFSSNNSTQLQNALTSQNSTLLQEFLVQMKKSLQPDAFDLLNKTLHELGSVTNSTGQEVADRMNAGSAYEQMALSDMLFIAGSFMFYEVIAQLLRTACGVNKTTWSEVWSGRAPLPMVNPVVENVLQSELNTVESVNNPTYTVLMPGSEARPNEGETNMSASEEGHVNVVNAIHINASKFPSA